MSSNYDILKSNKELYIYEWIFDYYKWIYYMYIYFHC